MLEEEARHYIVAEGVGILEVGCIIVELLHDVGAIVAVAAAILVGVSIIELSKTEQKLLRILVENRGQTLPRATLVDRIWTDGAEYVDENALSVTVKRLRGKLEDTPSSPQYLKTVYGIGYTWAVK